MKKKELKRTFMRTHYKGDAQKCDKHTLRTGLRKKMSLQRRLYGINTAAVSLYS